MKTLNLPSFNYNVKNIGGKLSIFDTIRRKYITLTPEEWVRQHLVNYFTVHLGYPKTLIQIERELRYNRLRKRTDIVVFNRAGTPWMIVECKAPNEKVDDRVLQQIGVYNATIKATYLVLSNGLTHVCCEMTGEGNGKILNSFPAFPEPN